MKSVGHHFTLARGKDTLNLNLVARINHANNFYSKYPFGLLPFLWKLYELPIPENLKSRNETLRILFYPDGGLMKNLQYKENCTNWIEWLQLGTSYDEIKKISEETESKEITKCIYKNFGSTQFGLGFEIIGDKKVIISNLNLAIQWINWFCDILDLPHLELVKEYNIFEEYKMHRIPLMKLRRIKSLYRSLSEEAISDALVMRDTWSVTISEETSNRLEKSLLGIPGKTKGLPNGIFNEIPKWVRSLNLNDDCKMKIGPGPCNGCKIN
jgi:hypothetical protein